MNRRTDGLTEGPVGGPTNGQTIQLNNNAQQRIIAYPYVTAAGKCKKTRPDTRPIPVADGWAGAKMRVFPLFNSSAMDQPTNRPTDGRTKPLIESLVRD